MTSTKTALVTGANKGIGRAAAAALARQGFDVYLGARDEARGRAAADALAGEGLAVRWVALDVTDQASVDAAAARVQADRGALDVLVCNAGIGGGHDAPTDTPAEVLERTYAVNVFGTVRVIGAFAPLVRAAPEGRIVVVGTELASLHHLTAGDHPMGAFPLLLAYNSSKTAVNAAAVHYAKELAESGVLVNVVSPGYVATDLNGHQGVLTPEQAAPVLVHAATLPADGPTGSFIAATPDGEYVTVPW